MVPISVTLERKDPSVGVVALVGEHDAYSASRLENELAVLLDSGLRIVVDLRGATFVDSQTLSVLLAARHQAEQAESGFTIVLDDQDFSQVHRILDMTGLGPTFAVYPKLEEALAAARDGRTSGSGLRVAGN